MGYGSAGGIWTGRFLAGSARAPRDAGGPGEAVFWSKDRRSRPPRAGGVLGRQPMGSAQTQHRLVRRMLAGRPNGQAGSPDLKVEVG